MIIEEGIVAYVTSHAPLVAIQGARIYPDVLPQSPTLPASVFFSISDPSGYNHTGEAMKEQRFQFDCWGRTPMEAIRLKNTYRQAFSGFKGLMGSVEIYAAFPDSARTMNDDEAGLYRRVLEVLFQYKET